MAKTATKKKTTSKNKKKGTRQVKKRTASQLKKNPPKQIPQNTQGISKTRRYTGVRYGAGLGPARERIIKPIVQSINKRPIPASPPVVPPPPPSIT